MPAPGIIHFREAIGVGGPEKKKRGRGQHVKRNYPNQETEEKQTNEKKGKVNNQFSLTKITPEGGGVLGGLWEAIEGLPTPNHPSRKGGEKVKRNGTTFLRKVQLPQALKCPWKREGRGLGSLV